MTLRCDAADEEFPHNIRRGGWYRVDPFGLTACDACWIDMLSEGALQGACEGDCKCWSGPIQHGCDDERRRRP